MNSSLSLPPIDDLDTMMLKVARNIAMDLHPLDVILANEGVKVADFHRWKTHPRFLEYLKTERETWNAATNAPDRTKLKASVIIEEFMIEAHRSLHDTKIALNQRVELGKLLAKIAGLGEPKVLNGAGGPGFHLQINIGPGVNEHISIRPTLGMSNTIDHEDDYSSNPDLTFDDGYDPFTSPNSLEE